MHPRYLQLRPNPLGKLDGSLDRTAMEEQSISLRLLGGY